MQCKIGAILGDIHTIMKYVICVVVSSTLYMCTVAYKLQWKILHHLILVDAAL